MSEKIEYVEVTVRVPKKIVDFLEAFDKDVKEYIERNIPGDVRADIEAGDVFLPKPKELMEKYGLTKLLKDC